MNEAFSKGDKEKGLFAMLKHFGVPESEWEKEYQQYLEGGSKNAN